MSFDRLAPHYRWMETVLAGNLLQRVRTRWLKDVRGCRRALLAGEGPGRMLAACLNTLPNCELTVVDSSAIMLSQAERQYRNCAGKTRVTFRQADLRKPLAEQNHFDLIITNFCLDCFDVVELEQVVKHLAEAATNSAQWLVADFCVPTHGWRRWRARLLLAAAYAFFRHITQLSARKITSPDLILAANGFQLQRREAFNHGLLHADLWARQ